MTEYIVQIEDSEKNMSERFVGQLRSYPELIRCKDCIYFDKPHVENNGTRIEYDDLPEEAFENSIGRLVNSSYGINVGGRCCRDYNVGYSEDKRVFVPETNYCGRAERKTVEEGNRMTRLIDADEMLKRLESWNTDDVMDKALYNFTLNRIIEQPTVETIPIEWIEFYISEIEDNVPDVALAFKELIEIWNEEHLIEQWKKKQEKQNGD